MTIFAPRTRNRASGWTAERQAIFLDALRESGSAERAAVAAGLSASSGYRLRKQPRGADFAAAWDMALLERRDRLRDELMTRVAGRKTPVLYRGRVIGERVEASNRLLLSVLKRTLAPQYAASEDLAFACFAASLDRLEALKFNESAESVTFP